MFIHYKCTACTVYIDPNVGCVCARKHQVLVTKTMLLPEKERKQTDVLQSSHIKLTSNGACRL